MSKAANRTERLYERVAAAIRLDLASEEFVVGSRMASERDLAQRYGVSRPTVREAIIALELDGLVEVRTNSGVYVRAKAPEGGSPGDTGVGPFELLEARRMFEADVCGLAAQLIDREGLDRLSQLVDEMKDGDLLRAEAADRQFHVEIARATQNSAMERVVAMLWDARDDSPQYALLTQKVRAAGVAPRVSEHRHIVDALTSGSVEASKQAMADHLGRVIEHILDATEIIAVERVRADVNEKRRRLDKTIVRTAHKSPLRLNSLEN